MNKDVKVLLIVFGSLFGLVVIAVIAAVAFIGLSIGHQVAGSSAKKNAAAAAKIATITLPRGYRYELAMDIAFMNMVMIVGPKSRRDFTIELQGMALPASASSKDQLEQSMRQGLGAGSRCTPQGDAEELTTASGKPVSLQVLHCEGGGRPDRILEFGIIPSHYPIAMISATGSPAAFDHAALRAIVTSMK